VSSEVKDGTGSGRDRHCTGICLYWPRKSLQIPVRVAGLMAEFYLRVCVFMLIHLYTRSLF
jgi:hypothetical protein